MRTVRCRPRPGMVMGARTWTFGCAVLAGFASCAAASAAIEISRKINRARTVSLPYEDRAETRGYLERQRCASRADACSRQCVDEACIAERRRHVDRHVVRARIVVERRHGPRVAIAPDQDDEMLVEIGRRLEAAMAQHRIPFAHGNHFLV